MQLKRVSSFFNTTLTFNLQEKAYNIYIPGQPTDTAV